MTAKVILNPYSNRWNSQKRWAEADAALKAAGVDFELVISKHKGQIVELTEQAVQGNCAPIIIAGVMVPLEMRRMDWYALQMLEKTTRSFRHHADGFRQRCCFCAWFAKRFK